MYHPTNRLSVSVLSGVAVATGATYGAIEAPSLLRPHTAQVELAFYVGKISPFEEFFVEFDPIAEKTLAERYAPLVDFIGAAERQTERAAWLAQSERRLHEVWDNDADDVYNELLAR